MRVIIRLLLLVLAMLTASIHADAPQGRLRVVATASAASCTVTSDGSDTNTDALVDAAADGDVVCLPAGTFTWDSSPQVSVTKAITLRGAGCTYDANNRPTTCQTIIRDNGPDPGSGRSAILTWTLVANKTSRMTDIEFQDAGTKQQAYNGVITVAGASTDTRRMRIDHVYFNDLNGVSVFSNTVLGVYDHNTFYKNATAGIFLYTYDKTWGGYTVADGSWADTVDYSSDEWLFIENNTMNRNTASPYAVNDAYGGARYVVRYNDVTNGWIEMHGTDSGQRARGGRAVLVDHNTFTCTVTCSYLGNIRSGTGVFQDNTLTGYSGPGITLSVYRTFYPFDPWGGANGSNPWDVNTDAVTPAYSGTATGGTLSGNSATMTDSGASFPTPNGLAGYSIRRAGCYLNFAACFSVILSNTATSITYYTEDSYHDLGDFVVQASPAPTTTTASVGSGGFILAPNTNILISPSDGSNCDTGGSVRLVTVNTGNGDLTWTPAATAPSAGETICVYPLFFVSGESYEVYAPVTQVLDSPGRGQGTQLLARTMSGCTESGTTVTCTTNSAHGFSTNNYVAIADIDPPAYRGTYQITVTGTTTFTYTSKYSGLSSGTNYGTVSVIPVSPYDQTTEPYYECRNAQGMTDVVFNTTFPGQIRSGEHYFQDTCYPGSFYTYPHPLTVTP